MLSTGLSRRGELDGMLDCSTESSADYYGFGVRLGVYFAWLSSYFANLYLPSEVMGSLDTNCIFLLALLISLFRGTVMHQLYQVDGLMVMQLSSGFLFSSLSIWGYRTAHYEKHGTGYIKNFGGFGTHVRLGLTMAISVYGAWFWAEGVQDGLKVSEDPNCQVVKTWFFHGFPIKGGIHILYMIMTLGCSIYYGCMCAAAVVAFVANIFGGWKGKIQFETGYSPSEFIRLVNIGWMITCALLIEMTLNENHMLQTLAKWGNIAFPAQLVPLLVGVLSFARVLWLIMMEWVEAGDEAAAHEEPGHVAQHPHRSAYAKVFRGVLRLLPPWTGEKARRPAAKAASAAAVTHEDMQDRHKPIHYRFLVGYLPWLSLFTFWRRELRDIENVEPTQTQSEKTEVRTTEASLNDEKAAQKLD